MDISVPDGRFQVDVQARQNRLVFRRQRAKHAIQLLELDDDVSRIEAAAHTVDVLSEALARVAAGRSVALVAAATAAGARTSGSSPLCDAALLERRLAEAQAVLRALTSEHHFHARRQRALVLRQARERARLVHDMGIAWKRSTKAPVATTVVTAVSSETGDGVIGDEGEAGADGSAAGADGSAAATGDTAGAVATVAVASASASAAGEGHKQATLCAFCAASMEKLKAMTCDACRRDFCGAGGRGVDHVLELPCVDIYECQCQGQQKERVCYDCLRGSVSRAAAYWERCLGCAALMCPKETENRLATCKGCAQFPWCKACRSAHDRECKS